MSDIVGGANNFKGTLSVNDPNGMIHATGNVLLSGAKSKFEVDMSAANVNLAKMKLYNGNLSEFSFNLHASIDGNSLDNINGFATLDNISIADSKGKSMSFN